MHRSLVLDKIPDRRDVLWCDSVAGQDPLFFVPATPTFRFALESLLVAGSGADNSQIHTVRLTAYLGGNSLATADLPAPYDNAQYVSYSGPALGALQGLYMDRLEFVGLSDSAVAYYELDDVTFLTAAVPEPSALAWSLVSGTGLLAWVLHRRRLAR